MITHWNRHLYVPAPCQPQRIGSNLDCVTNSAWISWDAAAGADSYSVSAVGGEGSPANCSTSSNTTCEVEDLACGVLYNLTVVAVNSNCDSRPSETITLETGTQEFTETSHMLHFHSPSVSHSQHRAPSLVSPRSLSVIIPPSSSCGI